MIRLVPILFLLGCAGSATPVADGAMKAITSVADPLYAGLVDACDAAEGILIDQGAADVAAGSDAPAVRAALEASLAEVRAVCLAGAETFETARKAQQAAYDAAAAADACDLTVAPACVQAAIDAATAARDAAENAKRAYDAAMGVLK